MKPTLTRTQKNTMNPANTAHCEMIVWPVVVFVDVTVGSASPSPAIAPSSATVPPPECVFPNSVV